jgi:hypothetical protein
MQWTNTANTQSDMTVELTDDARRFFDRNGDGKISQDEVRSGLLSQPTRNRNEELALRAAADFKGLLEHSQKELAQLEQKRTRDESMYDSVIKPLVSFDSIWELIAKLLSAPLLLGSLPALIAAYFASRKGTLETDDAMIRSQHETIKTLQVELTQSLRRLQSMMEQAACGKIIQDVAPIDTLAALQKVTA